MLNSKYSLVIAGALTTGLLLSGCSSTSEESTSSTTSETSAATSAADHGETTSDSHHDMDHPADGGPVPANMVEAENPTYPVGTEVKLTADHMAGMDGEIATIVGAYDTYTYSVSFVPTTGGPEITDHRWVVQEELKDAGNDRLADGTEVTITANHMTGMDGAAATIDYSTDETVYVVDYEADGMLMTNHKWVTESEGEPAP